ncbi:hypothetical protein [Piscinibacter gummiphilus]|uniref:hypothetical protein n=1 Tax=Piscinibacter gummiphilus TaxID=946333 RepID=UPI00235C3568|nr:hypothetical protein [Piscinibacter gummiphilus]GLS92925.1 hypothetical protein GCM10007918_02160 [Piscinibacter gummiphilus]
MLARLSAFVVWALVAGAIVFWGLRLFVSPTPAPANAVAVVDVAAAGGDLSRLFGVTQVAVPDAPPPESTRFRLLGVLAARDSGNPGAPGVALVSVDGKPPRPYRAGARVEDRLFLKAVSLRTASFGPDQGPVSFTLEVPRMPEPATGTLTPVDASQLQIAPPPVPQQAPQMPPQQQPAQPMPGDAQNPNAGPMGGPPPDNQTPPMQRGGPAPALGGANGSGRQ